MFEPEYLRAHPAFHTMVVPTSEWLTPSQVETTSWYRNHILSITRANSGNDTVPSLKRSHSETRQESRSASVMSAAATRDMARAAMGAERTVKKRKTGLSSGEESATTPQSLDSYQPQTSASSMASLARYTDYDEIPAPARKDLPGGRRLYYPEDEGVANSQPGRDQSQSRFSPLLPSIQRPSAQNLPNIDPSLSTYPQQTARGRSTFPLPEGRLHANHDGYPDEHDENYGEQDDEDEEAEARARENLQNFMRFDS